MTSMNQRTADRQEYPLEPKRSLDLMAAALLVILCASWGFQQVTIKVANQGVSPVLQAGIRSVGAAVVIGRTVTA